MNTQQWVLCFPRNCIAPREPFTPWDAATDIMRSAEKNMQWVPRHDAEESEDLVQAIPCALVSDVSHDYHVFRRINEGRIDLRNRISLVVGGHIDWVAGSHSLSSLVKSTLLREINEELGIDPTSAKPIGVVIDPSSIQGSRHIGIVHEVVVEGTIRPKATEEFSVRSRYNERLLTSSQLSKVGNELDPWSMILLGSYVNQSYAPYVGKQLSL